LILFCAVILPECARWEAVFCAASLFLSSLFKMKQLDDRQAELICGGVLPSQFGIQIGNSTTVATGGVYVSPMVKVTPVTQLNNSTIVSAYGGYKSVFSANIDSFQFNGIA